MLRKDNRRPQPNPRDKRYKVITHDHKPGKATIFRADLFDESATAARLRHAIDVEGRVKVAKPFVERVKDSPERHIHPRHKREAA